MSAAAGADMETPAAPPAPEPAGAAPQAEAEAAKDPAAASSGASDPAATPEAASAEAPEAAAEKPVSEPAAEVESSKPLESASEAQVSSAAAEAAAAAAAPMEVAEEGTTTAAAAEAAPIADAAPVKEEETATPVGLLPDGAQQCKVTVRHEAGNVTKSFLLQAGRMLTMGRHPSCDMPLEYCEGISANHCALLLRKESAGYALSIRDDSRNGTGARPGLKTKVTGQILKRPWKLVTKGLDVPIDDSWELKLPLKSRAGKVQIPEANRLLSIQVSSGPFEGLPVAGASAGKAGAAAKAMQQQAMMAAGGRYGMPPQARPRGNMVQTFSRSFPFPGQDQPVPRASGVIAAQVAPESSARPRAAAALQSAAAAQPPLAAAGLGGLPAAAGAVPAMPLPEMTAGAAQPPPKEKKRKEKKHKGEKANKGLVPGVPLAGVPAAPAAAAGAAGTEELGELAAALAAEKAWEKRRRKEKKEREKAGQIEAAAQPKSIGEVAGFGRGGVPAARAAAAAAPAAASRPAAVADDQASEKSDATIFNEDVHVVEEAGAPAASSRPTVASTARPKANPTGVRLTEAALQAASGGRAGAGIALNRKRPPPLGQLERPAAGFDPRDMSVSPISTPGIGKKAKKRRKKGPGAPGGSGSGESLGNAGKGKKKSRAAAAVAHEGVVDAQAGARFRSPDRWSPEAQEGPAVRLKHKTKEEKGAKKKRSRSPGKKKAARH